MTQFSNNRTPDGKHRASRSASRRRQKRKTGIGKRLLRVLSRIPFPLSGDSIGRALICVLLTLFLALLQTAVFTRFRPFGAVPDLMLSLVVAIAMTEGEKWGACYGLAAAYLIEAIGSSGITLLPLLYMPLGYLCPLITRFYLKDSAPIRILYTLLAGVGRSVFTLLYLALTVTSFSFPHILWNIILPEYASTVLCAILPHLLVHWTLHPFHKPRSERVTTL